MATPSQASSLSGEEGVETRRHPPKASNGHGEGIVHGVRKLAQTGIPWSLVQVQHGPPPFFEQARHPGRALRCLTSMVQFPFQVLARMRRPSSSQQALASQSSHCAGGRSPPTDSWPWSNAAQLPAHDAQARPLDMQVQGVPPHAGSRSLPRDVVRTCRKKGGYLHVRVRKPPDAEDLGLQRDRRHSRRQEALIRARSAAVVPAGPECPRAGDFAREKRYPVQLRRQGEARRAAHETEVLLKNVRYETVRSRQAVHRGPLERACRRASSTAGFPSTSVIRWPRPE